MPTDITNRQTSSHVDRLFVDRWSPRAFDPSISINDSEMETILEAARWAPSSYNEQPWTFLVARQGDQHYDAFLEALVEFNQSWAKTAPVLGFATCRLSHKRNGTPNATAGFDTGAAWMALCLQARMLGYFTHGMGGFDRELAHRALNLPTDDHAIMCAFALGKPGDIQSIPEDLHAEERPSDRKPLSEVFSYGPMKS